MTVVRGGALGELAESTAKSADNLDLSRVAANVNARNVGDVNLRNVSGVSVRPPGAIGNALSFLRNLPGVKQIADKLPGLRKTDVNAASADAAAVRSKPSPTPVPEAKQREVVSNNLDIESPDGKEVLKNADDLATKPEVSRTLSKWGLRGGIGVLFLMLLYKKGNPIDAIEEGANDLGEGVKGLSELINNIFEAFKTLLTFLSQNWMVSSASSCCCLLLMFLPSIMGAAQAMTPRRPTRFGGAYY